VVVINLEIIQIPQLRIIVGKEVIILDVLKEVKKEEINDAKFKRQNN
jgi:hypothetical protein